MPLPNCLLHQVKALSHSIKGISLTFDEPPLKDERARPLVDATYWWRFGSPVDQCWKLTLSGIMERISRLGREGERLHSPGALPQRDFYWPEVYL